MYYIIEYSNNYSKTFRILWQYCKDEAALNPADSAVVDFTEDNANTNSFKIKQKITRKTGNNGRKDNEIMVPLKYLSNF